MPPPPKLSTSKAKNPSRKTKAFAGLQEKDVEGLEIKLCEKFKWKHTPRDFQLQAIKAQLLRQDVLVHAGTGSGKTMIAAGPHALLDPSKKMTTFVVSPLIALQEEQARTFRDEFGLSATAINSVHEGCTNEVMENICDGTWQIVLISPEIVLSPKFRDKVLLNPKMIPRILSVVVDEAHVVSHWGADFRKEYGKLGVLRSILPRGTPFIAMSATLSRRIRRDVLKKLEYDENNYLNLDIGNDRCNVSIVVRAMHNTMNTYSDMDFVIPAGIANAEEIPLTFIYADKINDGVGIEDRLNALLPENLRNQGIIRPYSAAYSTEHRDMLMELFREGIVRVLICTDAAGMGCNISNIDVVVQWKLPSCVSAFVQRAGRAARDPSRAGLAVLLVEKSVFDVNITQVDREEGDKNTPATKRKGVRQSLAHSKAPKGYAVRHGVQRGAHHGLSDDNLLNAAVPLDSKSPDEGLYSLVQTGKCRREVLGEIYDNEHPDPTAPCCDLCDPSLLNRTRPAAPEPVPRKMTVKTGVIDKKVELTLLGWRRKIWERDFKDSMLGPSVVLRDEIIETLSSVGPVARLHELEQVTGDDWPWFGKYGDELLEEMSKLAIAPMKTKAAQTRRAEKRPAPASANDEGNLDDGRRRKRVVASAPGSSLQTETAVTHGVARTPTSTGQFTHANFIPYTPHHPGSHTPHHHHTSSTPIPYPYIPYYSMPYTPYMYHYPPHTTGMAYPMNPYSAYHQNSSSIQSPSVHSSHATSDPSSSRSVAP
ncbi:hypothetical protein D9613_010675 [Agrocybe pediades]|uniref:DNA 3'-5' helicase n=1 Tax=Agrocybe pediades TaxID=84607 RepID=A0A8H4QG56_9AGAR|nr:hypothetical protein D9613_010675 [Agrocybe pediades]